jgi:hypothetical protein
MNRIVLALAGVGIVGFVGGALAEGTANWIGAAPSHRSIERYDMSIGVTAGQAARRPDRIEEDREVLNLPSHYGTLVGVTQDADAAVFWYRDAEGSLRNSVVKSPASRLLKIQCVPSTRYEADAREEKH